jgi:hypothetical protein
MKLRGRPRVHAEGERPHSVRIHNDLFNALDKIASSKYIGVSQLIQIILADWVKEAEADDE